MNHKEKIREYLETYPYLCFTAEEIKEDLNLDINLQEVRTILNTLIRQKNVVKHTNKLKDVYNSDNTRNI